MPKLLIATSVAKPKDRKAATSSQNLKKLIEKRVEKDAEDKSYTVVTLNTKMKLANVVAIINTPAKKLAELEGVLIVETYTIDPSVTRGRWVIENIPIMTDAGPSRGNSELSEKKKKKNREAADDEAADNAVKAKKKKKGKKSKKED